MDIYDTAAVRKVWQRVGLTTDDPERRGASGLLPMIRQEWELVLFYQALAGPGRPYGELARQSGARAAKLRAVHYMLTGQTVPRTCPRPERVRLSASLLRQKIEAVQQLARGYRQAAQQLPDYQVLFDRLACQTDEHARLLLEQLASRV